ncbi:MAG: ribbon-helix-helix protein, CopG family [Planctomycetes bacterium]|nr:ribbon-helix-helix protein, CopG family [Planctomycetota bacterium]
MVLSLRLDGETEARLRRLARRRLSRSEWVRQALREAIDQEALLQLILEGSPELLPLEAYDLPRIRALGFGPWTISARWAAPAPSPRCLGTQIDKDSH